MGSFLSVIPVVVRRIAANARLMAAVVIGAVLAAGLMSTMSTYTGAITELGLDYALRESGPDNNNIRVVSSSQSADEESYRDSRDLIEQGARQTAGSLLTGSTAVGRSATFYPTSPGTTIRTDEDRPRSHLQFFVGLAPHVRVVDGRLPETPEQRSTATFSPIIEAAIGAETAARTNVKVGDRYELRPFWAESIAPLRVVVVGIIEPLHADEPYWLNLDDFFYYPTRWETLPFFITEGAFFGAAAAYLPTMTADFWNLFYLDTSQLEARDAEPLRTALLGYRQVLTGNLQRTTAETQPPQVLETFDEKLFFTRIPLLVLVLQIAGIVLYYLFMVSTMVVERQAGEIALLKSRGATTAQVMQIYVIEGLLIFGVALALGPPLAAVVIGVLGQTPLFSDLTQGANLDVSLSWQAYAWAAGGALLAYITLLWPAYQATRRTVVQQRTSSSRPPKQPAFTRYYLDLVLVGVGAILFYQMNRRGSLVTEELFGEQSVDPLMLLTPAFFILTVGIVFLRLFPLALRLLAWGVARVQGVAVLIGMWQLVRNPVHYSRLVLLLMLATAVGTFAASFGTTLDSSYADRAAYESGADARLHQVRRFNATSPVALEQRLQEHGAEDLSAVYRISVSHGETFDTSEVALLGIDPETFDDVAYFRDDFAGVSLGSLLNTLADDGPSEDEIVIPPDSRYLGVWVNPTDLRGQFAIEAETRDATGRYFSFNFGPDNGYELSPGWTFVVADLSRLSTRAVANVQFDAAAPQAPLTLTSVSARLIVRVSERSGAFQIDNLQAGATFPSVLGASLIFSDPQRQFEGLPNATLLNGFDDASDWRSMPGILPDAPRDQVRPVSAADGSALELQWRPARGQANSHGLLPAGDAQPLSVFASEGFLKLSGLSVGDETSLSYASSFFDARIEGSFSLFPTLGDVRSVPALLANSERLDRLANEQPRTQVIYPNEFWFRPGPETVATLTEEALSGRALAEVISFAALRDAQERDPLVAAGWEGILFISFAAILLLSAIGFLIYSYLTAQRRTLEFAVLRTMGFSRRQIAAVVGFEQAFVIGLGMLAGSLLGMRLGSLMIRYMGVTETGDEVLPPMLLQVSWLTVGSAWLVLAVAFLVTIGIVVLLYTRLQLHRVLRIGET